MGMESMYKLSVLVNLMDKFSSPAAKVNKTVEETTSKFETYSSKMAKMATEGTALIDTGNEIVNAVLSPVKATFETQDALSELGSLGVESLEMIEVAASKFSSTWAGTTKSQFITAAYDIKSGIASLTDEGVAKFTEMAGITAKATKSTTTEMTSLFATGYGIYKDYYSDLSDIEFGEMFAGGIAQSVKQFKTTGGGMAQAISALGGSATSAMVPLEEQLSILGMLQATMSGSEAGTKYTAFLQSAGKAGQELGLSFVGANGQLKSMPEILGAVQGKFGDVLTAGDKMELQKAFGTMEAVKLIDLLYGKTDDLQDNIVTMYDTMGQGMTVAEEMAHKINAPPSQGWIVLQQRMQNTLEVIGNAMLPIFMQLQIRLDGILTPLAIFIEQNSELVSATMYTVMIIGGLVWAFGAIASMVMGVIKTYTLLKNAHIFLTDIFIKYSPKIISSFTAIKASALATSQSIGASMVAFIANPLGSIMAGLYSLGAMLMANPIVAAIMAIAICLMVLYNICEPFREWVNNLIQGILERIKPLLDILKGIGGFIMDLFTGTKTGTLALDVEQPDAQKALDDTFKHMPTEFAVEPKFSQDLYTGGVPIEYMEQDWMQGYEYNTADFKANYTQTPYDSSYLNSKPKESTKQTIIDKLIVQVDMSDLEDLKKLKKLIAEVEDSVNSNPSGNYVYA